MKALHFDGVEFQLKVLPLPEPAPGESLVKVHAAGICATDLEIAKGYMGFTGVPGHEFVGTVEQSDRAELVGARVVGEINCICGACDLCRRGLGRHCPNRTVLGIYKRDGCFAEHLTLPDSNLHVLPESFSDFQGVMVEPTAAAFRVVEQLENAAGLRVAVVGDGKLGTLVALVLAAEGARVSLVGRHPERAQAVEAVGVEFHLAEPSPPTALERSFPVAVECTGDPGGPARALALLEPMGVLVLKTTVTEPLRLASDRVVVDEISLIGSRCGPFPRAMEAIEAGAVGVDILLEASYPLSRHKAAFEHASRRGALKVLLTLP
jgi:threonine dehydrogenase-like Zn-dependent dehydrogenase